MAYMRAAIYARQLIGFGVALGIIWSCGKKNSTDLKDSVPNDSDVQPVIDSAVSGERPLAECDGDYYVSQESETKLADLASCAVVRGNVYIHYNPDMPNLKELASLEEVTGQLSIVDNAMLASLGIYRICAQWAVT